MNTVSRAAIGVWVVGVIGIFGLGYWLGTLNAPAFNSVTGISNTLSGAPPGLVNSSTNSPNMICADERGERVPCDIGREGITILSGEEGDFSQFWKAWNAINEEYIDPNVVTNQEKVWGAIQGLAGSLNDPYTFFLPPKEAHIFEEDVRGNFGGVGMRVGTKDGAIVVVSPLPGSPAERAGLHAGDVILKIDDATTTNMTVDKAVYLIRGEIGTSVSITVWREGSPEPLQFSVTREVIQVPTIETKLRDDGIFVISLFSFPETGSMLFRSALREFELSKSDKLIIDLRGNPGGYLEIAQDLASWFLPSGKVIVREEMRSGEGRTFRSYGYDVFSEHLKLAILVDEGTASAAEIFGGALREYGLGVLIGQKTFGKGSVQKLVSISENTTLKLTVARWLLPSGRNLMEGGIDPDISVSLTQEEYDAGKDPQMDKAVEVLNDWAKYKVSPVEGLQ